MAVKRFTKTPSGNGLLDRVQDDLAKAISSHAAAVDSNTTTLATLSATAKALSASVAANTTTLSALSVPKWSKVTVASSAFRAAASTVDVVVATLPPKCRIISCYADVTQGFDGVASPNFLTVGTNTGGTGELIAVFNAFGNVATLGLNYYELGPGLAPISSANNDVSITGSADLGTGAVTGTASTSGLQSTIQYPVNGGYLPSWVASTSVYLTISSAGPNLGNGTTTNFTAGSVTVYLLLDQIP